MEKKLLPYAKQHPHLLLANLVFWPLQRFFFHFRRWPSSLPRLRHSFLSMQLPLRLEQVSVFTHGDPTACGITIALAQHTQSTSALREHNLGMATNPSPLASHMAFDVHAPPLLAHLRFCLQGASTVGGGVCLRGTQHTQSTLGLREHNFLTGSYLGPIFSHCASLMHLPFARKHILVCLHGAETLGGGVCFRMQQPQSLFVWDLQSDGFHSKSPAGCITLHLSLSVQNPRFFLHSGVW